MLVLAQVFEKNHFPVSQNRGTSLPMSEKEKRRSRIFMAGIAVGLMLALIAPVAILAA